MIFCQYNYREYNSNNKHKHPMQPYSWENWVKMVNDNYKYCQNFNVFKWLILFFWVWIGRVKYVDLPSHHPYHSIQVKKQLQKDLADLIAKYNDCKKHPDKLKYHFNLSTTLKDIEGKIDKYKMKIDNINNRLRVKIF